MRSGFHYSKCAAAFIELIVMFSAFFRSFLGITMTVKNDYLGCPEQNSHCHISASGASILSFKVVGSCILICNHISDCSYVSTMSHFDVTLMVVNWGM